MTQIYFIRHAEPDFSDHDDLTRALTEKGRRDTARVTAFLADKDVDAVLSSPYRRAVDTVQPFAAQAGLEIETVWDFRERRVDSEWIEDFNAFSRQQWADFSYKRLDGETLGEVQARNIAALREVLRRFGGKTVAVGSHGTALSTIINYFDPTFGYEDFERIRGKMPWAVRFVFEGNICVTLEEHDLFSGEAAERKIGRNNL